MNKPINSFETKSSSRLRRIARCVPHGSAVLDIGCGSGTLMQMLNQRDCSVKGIDLSEDAIEFAVSRGLEAISGNVDQFEADARLREWIAAPYDFVIFSKVLMYLENRRHLMESMKCTSIVICQANQMYWKRLAGLIDPSRATVYECGDGQEITIDAPKALIRWGQTFGYRGRVVYGGLLRGRDVIVQLQR